MDVLDQDYHNFSSSSSHRLPTLSGTQAIKNAKENAQPISTSLPLLDTILGKASSFLTLFDGGIQRGLVTEVFGPPGVGKTTFAIQVVVNALHTPGNKSVTWIDLSSQLTWSRFRQIEEAYHRPIEADPPSSPPLPQHATHTLSLNERFSYFHITSLPKLLSLFTYPNASFPPTNTNIIVLEDLSNLILSSLPRPPRSNTARASTQAIADIQNTALAKRRLTRRFQVLSNFASALQKFAASNHVAILITSKAAIDLKAGQRAVLRPALSSQQWDNYLSARIALFREFWPEEAPATQTSENVDMDGPTEFERRSLRFAKVVRLGGKLVSSPRVGFVIEEGGLRQVAVSLNENAPSVLPLATQQLHPLEDVLASDANDPEQDTNSDELNEEQTDIALPETILLEVSGTTKRKAIEIADSDNESEQDEDSDEGQDDTEKNGFRPSSQLYQEDLQTPRRQAFSMTQNTHAKSMSGQTKEPNLPPVHQRATQNDEEDEMLLETYEKALPPLSQIGAEMSEPLTPSDDGRDIS